MNRSIITTAVAAVVAFGIGLGWSWLSGPPQGGVAVVDLDEVARQLGREEQMVNSVKATVGALSQSLTQIQQNFNKELQDRRAQLGEQPSPEQVQEFTRLRQAAQLKYNQLAQQADQQVNQHRLQLVNAFREQAKPIATKIAKEKGLTTIITRNDSVVFAFDEAVDITGDVIARMKAEQPARPAPTPAPAAQTSSKEERASASSGERAPASSPAQPAPQQQASAPSSTATP